MCLFVRQRAEKVERARRFGVVIVVSVLRDVDAVVQITVSIVLKQ
jgi:hypothetical protein